MSPLLKIVPAEVILHFLLFVSLDVVLKFDVFWNWWVILDEMMDFVCKRLINAEVSEIGLYFILNWSKV